MFVCCAFVSSAINLIYAKQPVILFKIGKKSHTCIKVTPPVSSGHNLGRFYLVIWQTVRCSQDKLGVDDCAATKDVIHHNLEKIFLSFLKIIIK